MDRVLPDFSYIASKVVDRAELPAILKEIYDRGYYAGVIDAENNWWVDFDKSVSSIDECYQAIVDKEDNNA